jgi:hypothetical protein
VSRLNERGRHSDGGGLYLDIGNGARKRWIFRYRDRRTGKLRDMGLGAGASVTLAQARAKAAAARVLLADGKDPLAEGKTTAPEKPTFGQLVDNA